MPIGTAPAGPEAPAPAARAERGPVQAPAVTRAQEAVRSNVGGVLHHHHGIGDRLSTVMNNATTPVREAWKPLPPAPSWNTVGKAAVVGAAVTMPVATAVVGGGAYAGYKTWNKLAQYRPFSWADRGARRVIGGTTRGVTEGVRSVASLVAYPFKLAGRTSANVLRVGARATVRTLDATVVELIRDIEDAINHKFGFPSGTNLIAQMFLGVKAVGLGIWELPKMYFRQLATHPGRTIVGTALGLGLLANAEWSLIKAGQMLVNGLGDLGQALIQFLKSNAIPAGAGV